MFDETFGVQLSKSDSVKPSGGVRLKLVLPVVPSSVKIFILQNGEEKVFETTAAKYGAILPFDQLSVRQAFLPGSKLRREHETTTTPPKQTNSTQCPIKPR